VEPSHVDYFQTELEPWVHYIPVKGDLSDLYEIAEYAVSEQNDEAVKQIIRNANQWCLSRLNTESLIHDMADIWDRYASLLHQDDGKTSWGGEWTRAKTELMHDYDFQLVD